MSAKTPPKPFAAGSDAKKEISARSSSRKSTSSVMIGLALGVATIAAPGCGLSPVASGTTSLGNRFEWAPEESMLSWQGIKALSREEGRATFLSNFQAFVNKGGFKIQHASNPLQNVGVSWGDPHFSTYDMAKYRSAQQFYFDNNLVARVVLAKTTAGASFGLQARQVKLSNGWVSNMAAGVRVGQDTVSVDLTDRSRGAIDMKVNGMYVSLPAVGASYPLRQGAAVYRTDANTLLVAAGPLHESNDRISLQAFGTGLAAPNDLAVNILCNPSTTRPRGQIIGGLGADDDNVELRDELRNRNGTVVPVADLDNNGIVDGIELAKIDQLGHGTYNLTPQEWTLMSTKINGFNSEWVRNSTDENLIP